MNTTHPTATISADADLPIIRITRDFAATPAQLMRAHTDPDVFARWIGPDSLETEIAYWDARSGGSWRYVARRGDESFGFHGCFHEVGDTRIVQTMTFEGQPDDVALETVWFEDLGDGVTRLHAQSLVDSFEGRNAWLGSGMEVGVNEGYAALDLLLPDLATCSPGGSPRTARRDGIAGAPAGRQLAPTREPGNAATTLVAHPVTPTARASTRRRRVRVGPERSRAMKRRDTLRSSLGELESAVMDCLWTIEQPLTVRETQAALSERGSWAYTTVMTVLDNLHSKGWVSRERRGRAYAYRPVESREEHGAREMRAALDDITDRNTTLLHFVRGMARSDAETLKKVLTQLERRGR